MKRHLGIQRLGDRRLLVAQPLPVDVATLLGAPTESRLAQVDLPVSIGAVAASGPLPLTAAAVQQAMFLQPEGIGSLPNSLSVLNALPNAASAAEALASVASRVSQNLESLRSTIQDALASPASSDAHREFLELAEEIVDQVIGRIDAELSLANRIPSGGDVSTDVADGARALVRSRLLAMQSTIESRLQSQTIAEFERSASDGRQVETDAVADTAQIRFELNSDAERAKPLESSVTVEQGMAKREIINRSNVADPAKLGQLQLLRPPDAANSETAFPEDTINAFRVPLDSIFTHEVETEPITQATSLATFKLGDLVGGVSSIDVLSALDATASELLEAVEEVRPQFDVRLAACLTALTVGYVLRIRHRGANELGEDFDAEGETVKLADGVSRPSFG